MQLMYGYKWLRSPGRTIPPSRRHRPPNPRDCAPPTGLSAGFRGCKRFRYLHRTVLDFHRRQAGGPPADGPSSPTKKLQGLRARLPRASLTPPSPFRTHPETPHFCAKRKKKGRNPIPSITPRTQTRHACFMLHRSEPCRPECHYESGAVLLFRRPVPRRSQGDGATPFNKCGGRGSPTSMSTTRVPPVRRAEQHTPA